MRTTFLGYETGRRALQANQLALEVTGHNLSNANAAGYSRQTLRMEATTPYAMPTMSKVYGAGMVGTGVQVTDIRAVRDFFLDSQVRNETASIGYWETRQDVLQEVEVIFGEPQGSGIRTVIDQFWSAWEKVASNASEEQYRDVLIQSGQELADTFQTVYRQLSSLQQNVHHTVESKVSEANALFQQIADLNRQISQVTGAQENPNDLIDSRARLTEQLARLMDADTRVDANGVMSVTVNGHIAVSGFDHDDLTVSTETVAPQPTTGDHIELPNETKLVVSWSKTGDALVTERGEMGNYLTAANETIQSYLNQVESMAQEIVYHVNAQHKAGVGLDGTTNAAFFYDYQTEDPGTSCAASMAVIISDPRSIAAASAGSPPGNGDNATLVSQWVKASGIIGDTDGSDPADGTTFDQYFRGLIGGLGVDSQESERMTENQQTLLTQIENQRTAYTGVSTDEELVNLMKFQQGYNAAARLVTTVDEMVDTIINRMGLVGR